MRCRETLQREVVKSRHYILKFLARRGFIYRNGVNWRPAPYTWLRQLAVVTLHAWKAQQRLSTMSHRLSLRRGPQIAVVAVARELVGYRWAVMRDLDASTPAAA